MKRFHPSPNTCSTGPATRGIRIGLQDGSTRWWRLSTCGARTTAPGPLSGGPSAST